MEKAVEIAKDKLPKEDNPEALRQFLEAAIRAYAKEHGDLGLADQNAHAQKVVWAHPMGVLATDHVGYLSFDLTRLPPDVADALASALEARRRDPNAPTDTSIWLYPMAREEARVDALAQMRVAHDAIVVKLELDLELDPITCQPKLCEPLKNSGFMAMQNPSLTDWRLSPGSFGTNAGALVGADGCEMVLPSNTALHEFNFHQVIGVPAADVDLPIDPAAVGKVRPGIVNEYRLSFIPIGHSLGQILYTFPLAPGESVNFAVIDWTRRDSALRNEATKLDESLVHELRRDRIITETVQASVDEWQRGGSLMGGIASSVGGAISVSNAIGGAYSTTSGSRDIAANTVQKLSDKVAQAATSSRELHSTVVVQSSQAEHEAIETRTVVNYNHSHALTILYYEVLRHFRVVTEFVRRRPALLTNIHGGIAYVAPGPPPRHEIWWPAIYENRKILEEALLDDRYKEGFDIVERRRHRNFVAEVVGPPPAPIPAPDPPLAAGPALRFFEFNMKTGGWFANAEDHTQEVVVTATLWPTGVKLNDGNRISPPGAFTFGNSDNSFVGVVPKRANGEYIVRWGEIDMVQIFVHQSETNVSFQHITVTGIDVDGHRLVLVDKEYESGHLTLTDDCNIDLWTLRPQPPPPPLPPLGRPAEEIEEDAKFKEFNEHLLNRRAHYERALRLGSTPAQRAFELASLGVGGGASLLEKVDNRPLEVLGDYVAYPCIDPTWSQMIMDTALKLPEVETVERLVTLPTRGVFAEAKLGHCNASEEIDNTRFWDWQKSPIPHLAPDIEAIKAGQHLVKDLNLQSTPFPQSMLNIVNPPSAPDPQGMTAALTALTTANIFRDMSGRGEVADLLKKLSDNSIGIAEAANRAREIQAKSGSGSQGGGTGGGSATGGSGTSGRVGIGQSGAGVPETLHQFGKALQSGVKAGIDTPEGAAASYQNAKNLSESSLFTPTSTPGPILGFAVDAENWRLQAQGHVPWKEWTSEQREIATSEYDGASKRQFDRIVDPKARDAKQESDDNYVLYLLDPYKEDIKNYSSSLSKTTLTSSPFEDSVYKQKVTFTATVYLPQVEAGKTRTATGTIRFDAVVGKTSRIMLGIVPLAGGTVSLTTSMLPKGDHVVTANYNPDTADIIGSSDSIKHNVQ